MTHRVDAPIRGAAIKLKNALTGTVLQRQHQSIFIAGDSILAPCQPEGSITDDIPITRIDTFAVFFPE